MARLSGRTAIVTGAAQGLGAVFAKALAAEGANVAVCDVMDPAPTVAAITAAGGAALGRVTDVTDPAAVAALVAEVDQRWGGIQILVNNASVSGETQPKPFLEISSQEFDRMMRVNVRGFFECAKAVVPVMRRQNYGKIINLASGNFFSATPEFLHYVASKGAVIAMTRAMARACGEWGIGVNSLAPGLTMSERVSAKFAKIPERTQGIVNSQAFKRLEQPQDLVGTLIFLASADSDFITGQMLMVDGGAGMH